MIKVDSVSKLFDSKQALSDVSFELISGQIFGLLGPNGAGKTTLIRLLLDIIRPDYGEITIDGKNLAPEDKDKIGYLPEERGLYRSQKVIDILIYIGMLNGLTEKEADENARYYLTRLDLIECVDKKLSSLSKGMQQKVQFISSIIAEPELIILDEPFSGLDPLNARIMKELIKELKRQDRIIILSTHQMDQVEQLCDSVLILNKGKKLISGRLNEIKESYSKDQYLIKLDIDVESLNVIDTATRTDNALYIITLKNGYCQKDLMAEIIKNNGCIEHFQKRLRSLEDIFIKLVKKDANK